MITIIRRVLTGVVARSRGYLSLRGGPPKAGRRSNLRDCFTSFAMIMLVIMVVTTLAYAQDSGAEFRAKDDLTVQGMEGTKNDADFEVKGVTSLAGDTFIEAGVLATPYGGLGAYENLLVRSENFSTTWAATNATLNKNVTAPDSATNAATTLTVATVSPGSVSQVVTTTVTLPYTLSVWAKSGTATNLTLELTTNGTGATTDSSSLTLTSSWKRYSITKSTGAGTTPTTVTGTVKTTGTVGQTIIIWGSQLEQASTPGVYVQTETTAVTASRGLVTNADLRMLNLSLGEAGTMTFGADTNLYRTEANILKTDDALTITGDLAVNGATTLGDGTDNLTVNTNQLFVQGSDGNVGIGTTGPSYVLDVNGGSTGIRLQGEKVMGGSSTASGYYSTAFGEVATASGGASVAMGSLVTAGPANYTVAIGHGVDGSNRLVNNITNSLMVGFNSTVPTLFVGPSSGAGTTGNVGIGTTSPSQKLHVNSTSAVGSLITSQNVGTGITNIGTLVLSNTDATTNNWAGLSFGDTATGVGSAVIGVRFSDRTNHYGDIGFGTRAADGFLDRMRITSTGNVGIGTTSPAYKLDVNGTAGFKGLTNSSGWIYAAGSGLQVNNIDSYSSVDMTIDAAAGNGINFNSGEVYFRDGGNVGIGVTGPGAPLHIVSANNAPLKIEGSDAWSGITFVDSSASESIWYYGIVDKFAIGGGGSTSAGKLHIDGGTSIGSGYGASASPTDGLIIQGNVGIGTTAPTEELHVIGDILASAWVKGINLGATTGAVYSNTYYSYGGTSDITIKTRSGKSTIFEDSSAGSIMVVQDNGNVGIGTTGPGYKLDVNGDVNIASGSHYKISGTNLAASDIGAEPTLTKGNLTEATSSVLTITGGTSSVIGSGTSIQVKQASSSQAGYLSSTDWSTFNSKQPGDSDLTAVAGLSTTGIAARTAADTWATRTITGTANKITVTNGDGVSGNPTLNIGSDVVTLTGSQTLTTKTIDADNNTISNLEVDNFKSSAIGSATSLGTSDSVLPTQNAVKVYVDNSIAGLKWKNSVRVATTADAAIETAFAAGQSVDGKTLVLGNRILLKDQTTATQNGIYIVTAGTPTRATDANESSEIKQTAVFVEEGTLNADTAWVCSNDDATITLGTTSLAFAQFAGSQSYQAGDGLSFTGNQINIDASDFAGAGLEDDGSENLRIAAAAAGNGLLGGAGSALAVGEGTGISVTADAVAHADTSSQANIDGSNGSVIQDITLDTFGHLTAASSVDLDSRYYTETESNTNFVNVSGDTTTGTLTLSPASGHALVTTAGNVGIGTTAPVGSLDVYSGAKDVKLFSGVGNGQSPKFHIYGYRDDIAETQDIQFYVANSDGGFWIKSDHRAMFLDTPTAIELQYFASGNVMLFRGATTGENQYLTMYGYDTGATATKYGRFNVDTAGDFNIEAQSGEAIRFLTGGTDQVTIDTSGNVGIGTTAPGALTPTGWAGGTSTLLEIAGVGGTAYDSGLLLRGSTADNVGLDIWYDRNMVVSYIDSRWNNDNGDILFRTKTSTTPINAITIKGTGNVGIGTTAPGGRLAVKGSTSDNSAYAVYVTNSSDASKFTVRNDGVITMPGTVYGGGMANIGSANNAEIIFATTGTQIDRNIADANPTLIVQQIHASSTGDILQLKNNASTVLTVQQTGNVGIGTTAPVGKLEINKTQTFSYPVMGVNPGALHFSRPETAGDTSAITWRGASASENAGAGIYVQSAASYGTKMYFGTTNTFGTGSQSRMMIDHTGNVGIGTTSPVKKLDVIETTSDADGEIRIGGILASDNLPFATLNFANTAGANTQTDDILASISGYKKGSSNRGSILFKTNEGSGLVDRMIIEEYGNVGIGTTGPLEKLHVSGGDILLDNTKSINFKTAAGAVDEVLQVDGGDNTILYGLLDTSDIYIRTPSEVYARFTNVGEVNLGGTSATSNPLFKITTTGNVGIGTTAPSDKLSIYGSNVGINITNSNDVTNYNFRLFSQWDATESIKLEGTQGTLWSGKYSGIGGLFLAPDGGNVGIGTTNPGTKLYVYNGDVSLVSGYAVQFHGASQDSTKIERNPTANGLEFFTGSTSRMFIKDDGNVGIGLTAPTANLDIKGNLTTALTGTVSVTQGAAAVTGTGTNFDPEIAVGDAIKVGNEVFTVLARASDTSLTLNSNHTAGASGVTAYKDSDLLLVQSGDGVSMMTLDKGGNLTVQGTVNATITGTSDNANLLDNIDSSSFLRSDASDSVTTGATLNIDSGATLSIDGAWDIAGTTVTPDAAEINILDGGLTAAELDATLLTSTEGDTAYVNVSGDTATGTLTLSPASGHALVTTAGNVGIGTTDPGAKLNIYGGDIKLSNTAGDNPYTIRAINDALWLFGDGATTQQWVLADAYTHDRAIHLSYTPGTVGAGAGLFKIGQTSKNDANYTHGITALYTNGIERMRINSSGKVGIATTAPEATLDVAGTLKVAAAGDVNIAHDLYFENTTASAINSYGPLTVTSGHPNSNYNLVLKGSGTGKVYIDDDLEITGTTTFPSGLTVASGNITAASGNVSASSGSGTFGTLTVTGAANLATASGKVGIGTTSPTEKLEVYPDTDVSAIIGRAHIGYVGSADQAVFAHRDMATTTNYALKQEWSGETYINAPTGKPITFRINNANVGIIDSTGNVGIGTTNPGTKLHVAGALSTSSGVENIFNLVRPLNSGFAYAQAATLKVGTRLGGVGTRLNIGLKESLTSETIGEVDVMTLLSTGNVGIGTTSPGYTLHVQGATTSNRIAVSQRANAGSPVDMTFLVDDTAAKITTESAYDFGIYNGGNWLLYGKATTGNVGIGTTSPGTKLQVNGTITSGVAGQQDGQLTLSSSGAGETAPSLSVNSNGWLSVSAPSGDIRFSVGGGQIYSFTTGNVGIGTTGPDQLLHILKNQAAHTGIIIENTEGTAGLAKINLKAAANRYARVDFSDTTDGAGSVTYDFTNDKLKFATASTADRMVIDSTGQVLIAGNVGIGTTNPSSLLHAVDTMNAATGNEIAYNLAYTTNKLTSGNDTGLLIAMTDTLSPGTSKLLDLQKDTVSVFNVDGAGNLYVAGNLQVQGTQVVLNVEEVLIEDNEMVLNANATGTPSLNAMITVERGDLANTSIRWNESQDYWELTNDGSTYSQLGSPYAAGNDITISSNTVAVEDDIDASALRASSASGLGLYDDGSNLGVFIEDGGQVGIGTTAPTQTLDVNGNIQVIGNIRGPDGFSVRHSGSGGGNLDLLSSTEFTFNTNSASSISGSSGTETFIKASPSINQSGTAGYTAVLINPTETTTGSGVKLLQDWQVGGTSKAVITSGGNVGIGTTNPTTKLDVNGTIKATAFDGPISTSGDVDLSGDLHVTGTGPHYISTGNVGIGTTGPDTKLDVRGIISVSSGNVFRIYDAARTGWVEIGFDLSANTFALNRGLRLGGITGGAPIYGGTDAGDSLYLESTTHATKGNVILVNNGGNVGIGTTSPGAKLQVKSSGTGTYPIEALASDGSSLGGIFELSAGDGALYIKDASGIGQVVLKALGDSYFNQGNVGIGTTGPGALLHAAIDAGTMPTISAETVGVFSNNSATSDNAILSIISGTAASASVFFGDSGGQLRGRVVYDNNTDSMSLVTNATTGLTVQSDQDVIVPTGNVGIGDTSPDGKLSVMGGSIVLRETDDGDTALRLFANSYSGAMTLHSGSPTATVRLDGAANTNSYFNTGGNVGIGTTAPVSLLQLNNAGTFTLAKGLTFGDGDTGFYEGADDSLRLAVGGNERWLITADLLGSHDNLQAALLHETPTSINPSIIPTQSDDDTGIGRAGADILSLIAGGVNALNIVEAGSVASVGIGTTAPEATLDVAGTLKVAAAGDTKIAHDLIMSNISAGSISSYGPLTIQSGTANDNYNLVLKGSGTGKVYVDDDIQITGDFTLASLSIPAAGTVTFGGDTNLYRNAANALRTGDDLIVDGNVGIGTTGPLRKLDVAGDVALSSLGTSYLNFYGTPKSAFIASATSSIYTSASGGTYPFTQYGNLVIQPRTSLAGEIIFATGSGTPSARMVIDGTGNVGIGTTGPGYKLEVDGTSDFGNTMTFGNGVEGLLSWGADDFVIRAGSGSGLNLQTNGSGTSRMFITTSGNVGIGTTATGAKLTLADHTTNTGGIRFRTASSTVDLWSSGSGNLNVSGSLNATSRFRGSGSGSASDPTFGLAGAASGTGMFLSGTTAIGFSTAGTEKVTINSAGNVGIGTTGPGNFKLQVAGNIGPNADNTYTLGDGTYRWKDLTLSGYTVTPSLYTGILYSQGSGYDFNDQSAGDLVRILENGNVGIGTTGPGSRLHVRGNQVGSETVATFEGYRTEATAGWMTLATIANSDTYGNGIINVYGSSGIIRAKLQASGDTGLLSLDNGSAVTAVKFSANSGVSSYINAGNVGIGTTGPGGRLHVTDGGTVPGTIQAGSHVFQENSATGDNSRVTIIGGTSGYSVIDFGDSGDVDIGSLGYEHSSNSMLFTINTNEAMRINNAGNVGIGTTAPGYKLDVAGDLGIHGSNYADMYWGTPNGYYNFRTSAMRTANAWTITKGDSDATAAPGDTYSNLFTVHYSKVSTASAVDLESGGELFVLGTGDSHITGNVGIGVTNPGAKLDVSGGDVAIQTSQKIILDSNDSSDSYWAHDNANDRVSLYVDGVEMVRINK